MLTPLDIENREFKRTLNGYNRDDVEDFMSVILIDYEKLYKESIASREKIETLTAAVEEYKNKEATLHSALMTAQQMSDTIKASATEQGELIVREAKAKANQIIRDANDEIKKLEAHYRELTQQIESYKMRVGAIIKSQLDILGDLRAETTFVSEAVLSAPQTPDVDSDMKVFSFDENE